MAKFSISWLLGEKATRDSGLLAARSPGCESMSLGIIWDSMTPRREFLQSWFIAEGRISGIGNSDRL
jgi:hypothetical protein